MWYTCIHKAATIAFLTFAVLASPVFSNPAQPLVYDVTAAAKACKYFGNVAYKHRSVGDVDSIYVNISLNCQKATQTLHIAPERAEAAIYAREYLSRLAAFHRMLVDMNVQRFHRARDAKIKAFAMARPISEPGFYLIAKSSGVLAFGDAFQKIYQTTFYPKSTDLAALAEDG